MISILSASTVPCYLAQLREQFELEWGAIDPFEGRHPDVVIPLPLLALDDQNNLAGGLAFSSFLKPNKGELGVWINALLIEPKYRRLGIASQLIHAADVEAKGIGIMELFVYTDISDLYQKLGWHVIETAGANSVLTKVLANE